MDEKQTEEPQETAEGQGPREPKDRREFEDRLDRFADRFSKAMSDGVKKLEDTFDKGKANLHEDMESRESRMSGSPRMGAILVGIGFVWFLFAVGALDEWIFPVLMIALGVFFLIRNR
jgi:hypothetical protein